MRAAEAAAAAQRSYIYEPDPWPARRAREEAERVRRDERDAYRRGGAASLHPRTG